MISPKTLLLAALPTLSLAKTFPVHTLSQLPQGSWLENIAVRPNSDLLVTSLEPDATVYTVKKPAEGRHSLEVLAKIPGVQNLLGISQVDTSDGKETYVVVGGNSTQIADFTPGTFGAWKITLSQGKCDDIVRVTHVSNMSPGSLFLNGVTDIPGVKDAVLVADSAAGLVGYLNLKTGVYDTNAFVFHEMVPAPTAAIPIGVNGIRIFKDFLYWTNSFLVSIYRIRINHSGYPAQGAVPELVANLSSKAHLLDDFTFDQGGNIYAATNFDNSVVYIDTKTGKWETIAGSADQLTIGGSTAVAFGRGKKDQQTLYVSTAGALGSPVNGTKTEGAKVVAIDL